MIAVDDLKKTAREYLRAATVLRRQGSFDSAVYLRGYAVEIALKARICRTLKWAGFPESNSEFSNKSSLKTHDLEALLEFTGVLDRIKVQLLADWSIVKPWRPEQRYWPVGTLSQVEADKMIAATRNLLKALLSR